MSINVSPPKPSRRLGRILSLDDFAAAARRHLPRPVFAYVSGGVETDSSLRANRDAFAALSFRPGVLTDVSGRSTATPLFGQEYAAPFGIAPMGLSALVAYRGDLVLAQAAAAMNIPMIMSGSSLIRLEEIVEVNPRAWFQAYLPPEPGRIARLVDRVAAAGYGTLVLTVDTPVMANRENNIRAGFSTPLRPGARLAWDGLVRPRWTLGTFLRTLARHGMPHFENSYAERGAPIVARNIVREFGARDHLSWAHVEQVRRRWQGRLVVKGILRGDDARRARDGGADGIIVSNHGGRQLDGTVAPLRVLPEVVAAVGGAVPVMLDSGIRRGTDILKALALGACFVFVGRPFAYAAAIGGLAGVRHGIDLLTTEVSRDMAMLGINSVAEMGMDRLVTRDRFFTASPQPAFA
ncbi:alpha-hydroxy-acid oxidizing protein [Roseomonas sp. NAR14]|uniref:Alpha-hydroxy-acid oxidizing protein n=1 Tax=Roseomonas acroporae TaxID=2937791 RepID=A0A9X1YAN4_9PROT|nr:alpha-hydroxy acid oxidase [Roseomonas acroporae]MCK8786618.1 alpha-hydroxy-acid oxidizing protein [Roseomonas acroporae]